MASTVTLVQRRLTHYRVPLFERMRELLGAQAIELRLLHGQGTVAEQRKGDAGHLPWAEPLATRYWLGGRICWQPFMRQARGSAMLILTQENKLLLNLPALVRPRRDTRIAFWGHGRNLNARDPEGLRERLKRWSSGRVDWWFAYTEHGASLLQEDGFPGWRISVLRNSIDTVALGQAVAQAKQAPRQDLRQVIGLPTQGPVGLYLGSLYGDKRIAWLLQAAAAIAQRLPGFTLAIAGDGPDRPLVQAAAAAQGHVRYLGTAYGQRKAQLLACADLLLNPGLVGLGVLDAFVAGLPLLGTDFCRLRSPEFAYLQPGENCLISADSPADYANSVIGLLQDRVALARLQAGARRSAAGYSVEGMAQRFCQGIAQCLALAGR